MVIAYLLLDAQGQEGAGGGQGLKGKQDAYLGSR